MTTKKWKTSGVTIKGAEDVEEAVFNRVPSIAEKRDILLDVPFEQPADARSDAYNFESEKGNVLGSLAVTLALRNRLYHRTSGSAEAFEISRQYISDKFIKGKNPSVKGKLSKG